MQIVARDQPMSSSRTSVVEFTRHPLCIDIAGEQEVTMSSENGAKRILLVGHCGFDGPRLQKELSDRFPGADVMRINSEEDLKRECEDGADLLLVNREPVGFETDGME